MYASMSMDIVVSRGWGEGGRAKSTVEEAEAKVRATLQRENTRDVYLMEAREGRILGRELLCINQGCGSIFIKLGWIRIKLYQKFFDLVTEGYIDTVPRGRNI
jgi:hypothetical protein